MSRLSLYENPTDMGSGSLVFTVNVATSAFLVGGTRRQFDETAVATLFTHPNILYTTDPYHDTPTHSRSLCKFGIIPLQFPVWCSIRTYCCFRVMRWRACQDPKLGSYYIHQPLHTPRSTLHRVKMYLGGKRARGGYACDIREHCGIPDPCWSTNVGTYMQIKVISRCGITILPLILNMCVFCGLLFTL